MNDRDLYHFIRTVIRQELAQISMAKVTANQTQLRSSTQRTDTEAPINNLRNIQSYGISSRAPVGTDCLTVPVASDPTHVNLVGVFDSNKPLVQDGETSLYAEPGQQVALLADGTIRQGSQAASEPVVLGNVLVETLTNLINAILNAPQIGQCAVGPVALDPSIRQIFQQELQMHIQDASTNIIGQKNFVERT